MFEFKRLRYHAYRFRSEFIYSVVISTILILLVVVSFPKDTKSIAAYMEIINEAGLDAVLSNIDANVPGWIFWLMLQMGFYLYFVVAVASIKIGARIFPTSNNDNMELLIGSTPQSSRRVYLENYLSGSLTVLLILIPSILILTIFSILNGSADVILRLIIAHMFLFTIGLFFMTFSSMFSILRFSKNSGAKAGYFYMIYAFLVELSSGSLENPDAANISVNYYLSPSSGLPNGDFEWQALGVIIAIIIMMFGIAWWKIKKPNYIENVGGQKEGRLNFLPTFSPQSSTAKRFPVVFDQLRMDRGIFYIWTTVLILILFYVNYMFGTIYADDPAKLTETLAGFDIPFLKAFTHGHDVIASYTGFMTFEFYGLSWMYFGLFILIIAINIPNRDIARGEHDVVWANNLTQEYVINSRTIALGLQFSVMYWLSWLSLVGMQLAYDADVNYNIQFQTFFVGWFYYLGLILLLVGLAMIPMISKGKRYVLWFYIFSALLLITAFVVEGAEFLKYLSIVYYYDAAGMANEIVSFGEGFLSTLIFTVTSTLIYIFSLKYKYKHAQII